MIRKYISSHVIFVTLLVSSLFIAILTLLVSSPPLLAYDGRCSIENVTTGFEGIIPFRHRYIEFTISSTIDDGFVHGGRAYSDLPWLSDEVVKGWRVVPPSALSINHWRVVIETRDFVFHPFLLLLYGVNPRAITYLRCSLPDPTPPPDQIPIKNAVRLAPALNNPSQEVCYEAFFDVDWNGNTIYLSGRGDNLVPLAIDDVLELTIRHPDGTMTPAIRFDSMTKDFGPVDVSQHFQSGVNNVNVRILDVLTPNCGGSEVWLVWETGLSPPNEDPYRIIDNLAIREAQPSARLRYPFQVPSWMRWITSILRKGSNATISLVAPDGTVYDSSHPAVDYKDTSGYAVLTLGLDSPVPGTWEIVVDVTATNPESIFLLSVAGKQGETSSTDTIAPLSSIQVNGTRGSNGWFLSDALVTSTAEDNPGGSGINLIEVSRDTGATWQKYEGPIALSQEGVFTIGTRATDNANNIELLPVIAVIGIDRTSPQTTGVATGSRDIGGIFRSCVNVELIATDTVSGVDSTFISFNNGATWSLYTGTITLCNNGVYNLLFRSVDKAGNQEQARKSGPIDIQRLIALSKSLLTANGATTIATQGV